MNAVQSEVLMKERKNEQRYLCMVFFSARLSAASLANALNAYYKLCVYQQDVSRL
jgi:hypothetical protein